MAKLYHEPNEFAQNILSKKESRLIDSVIDDLLSEEGTSGEELAKESISCFLFVRFYIICELIKLTKRSKYVYLSAYSSLDFYVEAKSQVSA